MKRLVVAVLALLLWTAPSKGAVAAPKFFPYPIHQRTLANGLAVIVIPTPEFKDMVTFATPVFAGSRNETQPGKSGLAHLFEHVLFLHEYGGQPDGYAEGITRMGADNNAWTDYDMTFYHPFTFPSNLLGKGGLLDLEASRFKALKLDRKAFQVEAGAVLGEYRRIFSNPTEKMVEILSPLAFPGHPYGHTIIGYREDVENMPNAWDAAWEFYHAFYRPNNVAVVIVGDVDPEKLFPVIEKAYADWKPLDTPKIPVPAYPKRVPPVHVDWEADVAPHLMVGWHTPAMNPATAEGAMALVLPELITSRSAPLYQELRYRKQTVTNFVTAEDPVTTDPRWLLLDAELSLDRFKKDGVPYVDGVQADVIRGVEGLSHFSAQPGAAKTLDVIKSKVKNDFLAQLDTTEAIATTFAKFYRFNRNADVLNQMMESVTRLTPADVDAYAARYFNADGRVVATLWHGKGR